MLKKWAIVKFLVGITLGFTVLSTNVNAQCNAPGWASQNGGVTGGGSAIPTVVSTYAALKTALTTATVKVVHVQGTITFPAAGRINIQDQTGKSIIGLPGSKMVSVDLTADGSGIFYVKRCSNILFKNLHFEGPGAYDTDGNDNMTIDGCTNVWVDHCEFHDAVDGNLDVKNAADLISITWCTFSYEKAPHPGGSGGADDHRFSNLFGSSDGATGDRGKLRITMQNCWWGEGCKERMPRIRFGKIHMVNNLFTSSVSNHCIRAGFEADILAEGNYFQNQTLPIDKFENNFTAIKAVNNFGAANITSGTAFTPPYTITVAAPASIVSTIQSCAGAKLSSPTACDCGGGTVNTPPTVSLTAPANSATFTAPASITITANAADANGTVSNVQFFNGSTLLGSDATSPYSFAWANVAAGTYTITAKATDNAGAITTSLAITVVVNNPVNTPPTVSITSPANNATFTAPASITISANATDANGTVSNVQFFNGSTLLGSDATSPYSFAWTNVVAGTYTITANATDNAGAITTSSAITVVVSNPVNTPPTVSITAPANNAAFTAPASITISANATDANGTVSNVQFFNGSTLLGSDATSPYSFAWANVAAGTYTITAKATDNAGAITTSSAITVVVSNPVNTPPTVSITAPANNAAFTAPASIAITANAADADGTVSNVQFFNGSTLLGSDATSPYSFVWANVAAGTYTITAKATDNAGAITTSSAITVVVSNPVNTPPTVSITSPANNTAFTAPASITISANAADANGTVSNVQFFNGSTLLGSDATSPYSFTWTNVAAGTYTISVKATDDAGAITTSSAVTVTVNPAQTGVTIQAETACTADGILNETVNAGFHGTGYVNLNNAVGTSATWVVNSTTSQAVSLNIRYANASANSRNMSLSVNGSMQIATVLFPSTGAWTTWNTATVQVNLAAGRNTLQITSLIGEGAPNIDELTFGSSSVSAASCIAPNQAPTVSIASPSNNASFTAPASIAITANAADADGTVSNVQFFNGTTLLGSASSSPYSFSWTNIAAGTYSLTAVATDNLGAVITSSVITVVVNNPNTPPTVSISAPANNASFVAPASITISANAADADGTVSNVQFFNGATLLGSATSAPYSFTWTNVAAGTYSITALATDNQGAVTTSSVITVIVNNPTSSPATIIKHGSGSSTQSVIEGTSIVTFNYTWTNATTVNVTGLPAGITLAIDNAAMNVVISGTPSEVGTFPFTITMVGGNPDASRGGTITVSASATATATKMGLSADNATISTSVAPNPSTESFLVKMTEPAKLVRVFSSTGIQLYQYENINSDLSFGNELTPGLYVVIIEYNSGRKESVKILKN